MSFQFSKSKVEKAAKAKERTLEGTTDNKSALRAVARYQVTREMYLQQSGGSEPLSAGDEELIATTLIEHFYKDAKFQPSWKDVLEKHAPALLAAMQGKLGTPSPRGRRPTTVEVSSTEVAQTDPDAILGTEATGTDKP